MSSKRYIPLIPAIVLLFSVAIVTMGGYAHEDTSISKQSASQIAQTFLIKERSLIPEWGDASLQTPKAHYDLEGDIAAYVIPLSNPSGKEVGYITVSGENLPNPILEFSTEPARYTLKLGDQLESANRDPMIDFDKPLYLGVLAYFYPVSNRETLELINMGNGEIVEIPEVPPSILEWKDKELPRVEATPAVPLQESNSSSMVRKVLYGPDYLWYRGCGPTAVGNLMGYWADRGYPNLVYGGSQGDYRGTIDQLAYLMGTSPQGWTWLPIDDDIRNFTNLRGYTGFNSDEIDFPGFDHLKNEIDLNRPSSVLVNGHVEFGDHFITMFGYEYDPTIPNYQYMMVHDTWGDGDYWVQYGVGYSGIWMDTMHPPQIQLDTTPPTSTVHPLAPYQIANNFLVEWSGVDLGWGIAGFDVQVRDGLTGSWTGWITDTESTNAMYYGLRGHQYFFRSSAFDLDHNQESYDQGNGDTNTLIAPYILSGKVVTNRDVPIMTAQASASPSGLGVSFTDGEGAYKIGLTSSGNYTVTIEGNSNFGSLPSINNVEVINDVSLPVVVLPPSQDLLANGNFESGTSNWVLSGAISPTISTTAWTGDYALVLGGNPSEGGGYSSISQTVSLPPEIDRPTLSFGYQAISNWNPSPLIVSLSGITTTTYNIPLYSTEWGHAWFDLSDYKGQEISVEFRIPISIPSSPNTVRLDDFSIGPVSPGVNRIFLPIVSGP